MTQNKPPFDKIADGLQDAIGFANGDTDRARVGVSAATLHAIREIVKGLAPSVDVTDTMPLFYDAQKGNAAAHIGSGGAGLDSLDRVEIVMLVDDEFNIETPDEMVEKWCTVTDIATDVEALRAADRN